MKTGKNINDVIKFLEKKDKIWENKLTTGKSLIQFCLEKNCLEKLIEELSKMK
jgi:hypothetical protein